MGCDDTRQKPRDRQKRFLLTHPVWDVTKLTANLGRNPLISTHTSRVGCDAISTHNNSIFNTISTHTSRVGCDWFWVLCGRCDWDFYSHIPCGMWLCNPHLAAEFFQFLLTHPVWDVTYADGIPAITSTISTHTSRVGCDCTLTAAGVRLIISTHTSRVGCDLGATERR